MLPGGTERECYGRVCLCVSARECYGRVCLCERVQRQGVSLRESATAGCVSARECYGRVCLCVEGYPSRGRRPIALGDP